MIILRHCESEFNRLYNQTGRDPNLADPSLSAAGKTHADELVSALGHLPITRILVSPFTRTLQTATPLARALNITPEISPLLRERGLYSCDIGTAPNDPCRGLAAPRFCGTGCHMVVPPAGK
ncbi:MAG: histidine phosphatase family protein [Acetobacter cibinongensis]